MHKIAVIPGDGTGPEVVREGLKVLEATAKKYNFKLSPIKTRFLTLTEKSKTFIFV